MTEDEKRKFDSWQSLRDHAWREFEEKSRAKWQLSFGIWGALLATAGALIASGAKTIDRFRTQECSHFVVVAGLWAVVIAHAMFLLWTQAKLQKARERLSLADGEMRKFLGDSSEPYNRKIWTQAPMYVELSISALLAYVLFVVFQYLSP